MNNNKKQHSVIVIRCNEAKGLYQTWLEACQYDLEVDRKNEDYNKYSEHVKNCPHCQTVFPK